MKAIETEYRGYKFRSRLEARWAVFFDACGVRWEYEPEGFDLGDGIYYLPDFLLHNVYFEDFDESYGSSLYVEVKGHMTDADLKKVVRFGENCPLLVLDNLPDAKTLSITIAGKQGEFDDENITTYDIFFYCIFSPIGMRSVMPFVDTRKHFVLLDPTNNPTNINKEITTNAYNLARQSRFEHGENPNQGLFATPIDVLPSPNGINIDILTVKGMPQYFVKAARLFSAITGADASITLQHPIISAADAIGINWCRFLTKRLSGGNSYGSKGYYFAVDDVPALLLQYVEHNYHPKSQKQELYNQAALELRKWFISIVIPQYGKNATKI